MVTIGLRAANAGDDEFIFGLHLATLGPYVDQVWGWDDDEQRGYLRRTVDLAATHIVVVDGVDAGRLNVADEAGEDHVRLGLLEIAPHRQRQGIGGRIVRSVLAAARARGKGVALSVLEVNADARRLYTRLGFVEASRDGDAPEVRIQMRAGLTAAADRLWVDDHTVLGPWAVRHGTAADRDFVVEMARHASVIEDRPLPAPASDDVLDLLPGRDDVVIVVADVLGAPVGAAWTLGSDPPLLVDDTATPVPEVCIAVAPGSRGRGVGGVLLGELARCCAGQHDALCLNVHQRNHGARALYRRQGFEVIGPGRGPFGVAMRKPLRSD